MERLVYLCLCWLHIGHFDFFRSMHWSFNLNWYCSFISALSLAYLLLLLCRVSVPLILSLPATVLSLSKNDQLKVSPSIGYHKWASPFYPKFWLWSRLEYFSYSSFVSFYLMDGDVEFINNFVSHYSNGGKQVLNVLTEPDTVSFPPNRKKKRDTKVIPNPCKSVAFGILIIFMLLCIGLHVVNQWYKLFIWVRPERK